MKNTEKEIERTLESLSTIKRAPINPFFFARLQAKLASNQKQEKLQLRVAWSSLAVVFILNLVVLFLTDSDPYYDESAEAITVLTQQYTTLESDIYILIEDYENE